MGDTLRKQVIRLAADHPEYRSDLLPLLKVAGQFQTGDKVLVPSKFLVYQEQDYYEGVVENAYTDGSLSIRVRDPRTMDWSQIPVRAPKTSEILPFTPGKTYVTYSPQLDELMDGWAKEVAQVLNGVVLSKKQVRIGDTLVGLLQVSSSLLPSTKKGNGAVFHLEFSTGMDGWSVVPSVRSGDTLKTPSGVKLSSYTVTGMPRKLRQGARSTLSKFLGGMTGHLP